MMQVAFHTRVVDKPNYVARLLRKAYRSGARVVVASPEQELSAWDALLWTFDSVEFLPHVAKRPGTPVPPELADSPLWLITPGDEPPHHDILVNLAPAVVPGFESFKRVIELISTDPDDVQAGRKRWKHYTERGYALTHHEVAA